MTLQQVRYLLEIAETGSISAAAKKLLLTQSDLSSLIRKIEQEFGITIFERTQKGVALTANGREFLKYARQMQNSYEKMAQIGRQQRLQFIVVSSGLTSFNNAFYQLCSRYTKYPEYSFSYYKCTTDNSLQMVLNRQAQVAAVSVIPSIHARRFGNLTRSGLEAVSLGSLSVNIYLRNSHPLLQTLSDTEPFPFHKLADYPMVDYVAQSLREMTADKSRTVLPFIPRQVIRVFDVSQKDELLRRTDAFMIGAARPKEVVERNQLFTCPIPDCYMDLYIYYYKDSLEKDLTEEYIRLVREELGTEMLLN